MNLSGSVIWTVTSNNTAEILRFRGKRVTLSVQISQANSRRRLLAQQCPGGGVRHALGSDKRRASRVEAIRS